MGSVMPLRKRCPACQTPDSLCIDGGFIRCTVAPCAFNLLYACPICDQAPDAALFGSDEKGDFFQCSGCRQQKIYLKKIQYLIDNSLTVDHVKRCELCNSPTIHRKDMNLSHRCFFFPKCSGQADLFGNTMETLVFVDFETTGLEIGRDAIIEIGAIKIDEEGYEHTFQTFIKPPKPLDPRITQITGITDAMVENAPALRETMSRFVSFIGNSKLVAHNADFDIPWLLSAAMRYDFPLAHNPVVCTLKWAKRMGEPHCSLGALTKRYGISHHNAHRALADAVSTKELYFIFQNSQKAGYQADNLENFREFTRKLVEKYREFVQA